MFALGDPPRRLLKLHGDEAAYLGETLAYELLAHEHVLPALHSSSDTSRTLITDYLDEGVDPADGDTFEEVIDVVAAVHTASGRWHPAVSEAMSRWRTGLALTARPADWISRPAEWHRLMRLVMDAHGPITYRSVTSISRPTTSGDGPKGGSPSSTSRPSAQT